MDRSPGPWNGCHSALSLKGRRFKGPQCAGLQCQLPANPLGLWFCRETAGPWFQPARGRLWLHFLLCHGVGVAEGPSWPAGAGTEATRQLPAQLPEHTPPPPCSLPGLGLALGTPFTSRSPHTVERTPRKKPGAGGYSPKQLWGLLLVFFFFFETWPSCSPS